MLFNLCKIAYIIFIILKNVIKFHQFWQLENMYLFSNVLQFSLNGIFSQLDL